MRAVVYHLSILLIVVLSCSRPKVENIEIPLTLVNDRPKDNIHDGGYYNMYPQNFYSNDLEKSKPVFKNIPTGFENAKLVVLDHNYPQFYFQEYHRGNISDSAFNAAFKEWNLDPSSPEWSHKPLIVNTHILVDTTNREQPRVIVDANANLDFGDDEIRLLMVKNDKNKARRDSALTGFETFYEAKVHGKIVRIPFKFRLWEEVVWTAPFELPEEDWGDPTKFTIERWLSGRSEAHAIASLDGKTLLFNSYKNAFRSSSLTVLNTPEDSLKNVFKSPKIGNYFLVNNTFYRYDGVQLHRMCVKLTRVNDTTGFRTAQEGFLAPDFSGKDFLTGRTISSKKLKGKFVFLDFWGSWCGPCRSEQPALIKAYSKIDTSKVAFVGIAYDKAADLEKFLSENPLPWPNIHESDESGIIKSFAVSGYPTSFILNPSGKVTHKKPWTFYLADTLNAMVKRWPWPQPVSVTSASPTR